MSPEVFGHFGPRCPGCLLREVLCVCAESPRVATRTRVTVIMHHREANTTSNTARLATVALRDCEIRVRGSRELPLRTDDLAPEGERTLLLFPSEDAAPLAPLAEGARARLIVPDGSWRQARKIAMRIEAGAPGRIERVRLPDDGAPSAYRLRKNPNVDRISTFEAIARALGILEGAEVEEPLERFFRMRVERALWSRRVLPLAECTTGIPEAAIRAFRDDGRRGQSGI